MDAGDYRRSWAEASGLFRAAVTEEAWARQCAAVRGPLGGVSARRLAHEQHATELPGAPDGEYAVLQFESSFQHKRSAVETVTPMREADGAWRVSGYFIC